MKFNPPSVLPPVGCVLLIWFDGVLTRATRTGYIAKKSDLIEYKLEDGTTICGLFEWAYP